nr:MAG: hypothetical protein [Marnaviridae sp.]
MFLKGALYTPTFLCHMTAVADLAHQRALLKATAEDDTVFRQIIYSEKADDMALLVEACLALYYQLKNTTTKAGVAISLCSFYHAVSGKSVTGSTLRVFDTLADELGIHLPFFQNGFGWIDILDGLYNNTKKVVKSALGDKIAKVFNHVVAYALYAKMGFDFDTGLFKTLEKKVIRPTIWNVLSFADAVCGLVLFLCKAGRQALVSGNVNAFFIDDGVLTSWLDEASELRKNSEFLSAPSVLGMAVPAYIAKVKDCIATGRKFLPHFKKGREHSILFNTILELESVLKRHECAMLSSSFRRAPCCVLLYGTAGVAKSFIAAGLFNHYCSVRGIDSEEATLWTRTENDDYYSGYKSHYAGVLYDDAAKYRSNVVQGVDPSIGDIITAVNNIPFVTPQADLPDKGKIPFLSEWVGVTSNVADLNANLFFNSSAAFLRRFAVRITPIVKQQYRVAGEDKIDTSFIPEGEQYPELWDFEVHVSKVEGMKGEFVLHKVYNSYADLLEYMTGVYEKHIKQQDRLMDSVSKIGPEKLCACRLPLSLCRCEAGEGEMLFGDAGAAMQCDPGCTKKHWVRIGALQGQKHRLYAENTDKVVRAFIKQLYDDDEVVPWFNPRHCDERDEEQVIQELTTYFEKAVNEFKALDARDRLNTLSDGKFVLTEDTALDTEYLTFTPTITEPGFYLKEQMHSLRNSILDYCGTLNEKELALLDVYLYDHAPKHIVAGWRLGDVIKGGFDYVKHYSKEMEDPERVRVRDFLMDTRKPVWYERLGVKFAVAYFENRVVYNVINAFIAVPGVSKLLAWCMRRAVSDSPRYTLASAGMAHDAKLGGRIPLVKSLILAAGALATAAVLYKFWSTFSDKFANRKPKNAGRCGRPVCYATTGECPPIGASERDWDCDGPDAQLDLAAVGKLPVQRESEKKNVWVTPERNISRLDVDPKRPHNEAQAASALRKNVCYAEVRGNFPAGPGLGRTRVLIADSETIVMNNHCLPVGSVITIWVGKRTEVGVQPSYVLNVDEEMVTRYPARDLAIVKTWAMPNAFKDIKHLFCKRSYQSVGPASYYLKEKDGTLVVRPVVGVRAGKMNGLDIARDVSGDAWMSQPMEPTQVGHCGMPLLINSPLGSVIVGIHTAYQPITGTAWAIRVDREDLDNDRHPEVGDIIPAFPVAQAEVVKLSETDKLYTDYHEDGHMITHGALRTFVARPKFTGRHTVFAHHVFARGHEFDPPIEDCMSAPKNAGWKQPQMVLETYLHPTHSMNEMIMRACTQAYIEHVEEHLTEDDWADIHPVNLSVAVNGFPGIPNVDAQKFTTSAGHGRRGPKLQFLTEPETFGPWPSHRTFNDELLQEIDTMRERAYKGIRPHAIYDSCFKDEMLSKAKVEAGKARSIYMCPVAFLTNVRMSTLGLCRVMIRRRDVFGVAIGLNTHSEEWDDLHKLAQELDGDNWIAGDFRNFESVLCLLISNCVSKVFSALAKKSGNFSEEEIMALRVWLADISNATINFFGELITLLGGEASGQQMTTPFNCVANNLLHMYAFVVIYCKPGDKYLDYLVIAREFFKYVRRNTLGDDVYLKVCPSRPEYNHTSIMHVFEAIGITYTMADKGAESRPYIPLEEVTFLKRSFRDHSAFPGMKVAALDRKSIYKMLCYTVPSRSVSSEEQLAAAMCSAVAEAFFHDKDFFCSIVDLIWSLPKTEELEARMRSMPLPSWNTMCSRFIEASPKLKARMLVPGDHTETTETLRSYCHASELEFQMEWSVDAWGSTTMERSSEDRIYEGDWLSSEEVPRASAYEIAPELESHDFSKNLRKQNKNFPTPDAREMAPKEFEQAIKRATAKERRKRREKLWNQCVFQADIDYDTVSIPTGSAAINTNVDVAQENTVFVHEPAGEVVTFGSDGDDVVGSMKMPQQLSTYLTRPRLIFSYVWPENGANGLKATFNPWDLYFASSEMVSKLAGYSMLRSKLHLKFVINGSPFYYGSLMANYTPLGGFRDDTSFGVAIPTTLVANSQKPHVWLENQNMSTVQMELPFLFPYPYVPLALRTTLQQMGVVNLIQYAPLLSANGTGSSNVDVQVYAWAEDVHLTGPTNRPIAQSEFIPDKQVSRTASAVQAAAGALSKIPVLGAYAKATEMAAGTLSGAASYFGFTNVPNVSDVQPYKPMPFQLASTEISEPVNKLSLQTKQETCVGAAQHGGSPHDELTIKSFAGRTSFIVGSQWNTTAAPGEILFTTAVSPQMFNSVGTQVAYTPVGWLANNFQWWRGPVEYTFKVIRSPYHRGRLQISWDAQATQLSQGPSLGNPNTLNTIMDLDEDSECSFTVPYMKPQLFLQNFDITDTGTALWSTDAAPTGSWPGTNGVLNVRVLNRLTAPEASSSATILVFVRAVGDFEFAGPREYSTWTGGNFLQLNASSSAVLQADVQYDDSLQSHDVTPSGATQTVYKQVFGERVTSLRELLHRSSLAILWEGMSYNSISGAGTCQFRLPIKRLPPPPGVVNNGWNIATTSAGAGQRFFYTKFHPLTIIGSCFIGYKGSTNVTVNLDQPRDGPVVDTLTVSRRAYGEALSTSFRLPTLEVLGDPGQSIDSNTRADIIVTRSGAEGMALTNTKTNAGMAAQLPYYSRAAFSLMQPLQEYNNRDTLTDANNDWWETTFRYNKASGTNLLSGTLASIYYASGPDFELVFFINVPIMTLVSVTTP